MKSAALWCCAAFCIIAFALPIGAVAMIRGVEDTSLDDQWMDWLESPPQQAIDVAANLSARADQIVESLLNDENTEAAIDELGDVDMVVSGGGNLDTYYMGIHLVVER